MNKKVPIIIIIILLIMSIILIFTTTNNENGSNTSDSGTNIENFMVIDNDSIWSYQDNTWSKVNYNKVNNQKLNVYIDSTYKGIFTLKYGSVWNLFSNNDYYSYDGSMFALSSNFGNLVNIKIEDINLQDLEEINSILNKSYNINDITLREKINIDLDNNGVIDKVICVNNLDGGDSNYFSLVYVLLNNEINILINESILERDYYLAPSYNIKYLFTSNGFTNIIIGKGYFSASGKSGNIMYQLIDKKYQLVVED